MPADTSPPELLFDGHVTDIWRVSRRRRRRRRSVGASLVEAHLHGSGQLLLALPPVLIKPNERRGVRHHAPPLDQVLLHQEPQQRHVPAGQQHRLRERLGEQPHGLVHLLGPHDPDPQRPGSQLPVVREALEGPEPVELLVGQEPPGPVRVVEERSGGGRPGRRGGRRGGLRGRERGREGGAAGFSETERWVSETGGRGGREMEKVESFAVVEVVVVVGV